MIKHEDTKEEENYKEGGIYDYGKDKIIIKIIDGKKVIIN